MIRILNIILLLLLAFGNGPKQYRIISLSSESIQIGNSILSKGDIFTSDDEIHWANDSQVMRVMDSETEEIFLFSLNMADVANRQTAADYLGIISNLSTDMQEVMDANSNGGYHYIRFSQNGKTQDVRLVRDMFMDEYPAKLSLYYHNPAKPQDELKTDDFRGFVDDLIITDNMVRRHLSAVDYYNGEESIVKNDYMLMMHRYINTKYQNIVYSYEDLKLFLTLKY